MREERDTGDGSGGRSRVRVASSDRPPPGGSRPVRARDLTTERRRRVLGLHWHEHARRRWTVPTMRGQTVPTMQGQTVPTMRRRTVPMMGNGSEKSERGRGCGEFGVPTGSWSSLVAVVRRVRRYRSTHGLPPTPSFRVESGGTGVGFGGRGGSEGDVEADRWGTWRIEPVVRLDISRKTGLLSRPLD